MEIDMGKYKGFAGAGMNKARNVSNVVKQAQKMLLYAEYEPENIWTGIARELLPDAFDYGTPSESVAFRSCTRFDSEDSVSSSDQ